jgi:RNA polymerase sigma-70 factor (ECF subfamily)
MATSMQCAAIQGLESEKRNGGSRQFANQQQNNSTNYNEEATLVIAAKRGDEEAFEILMQRYQCRILAVARRFTFIREDAEDIVQQSFQKAFMHLRKFEGKSRFSTWLTRIAINEALMFLRRGRRLREVSIDDLRGNEETPLGLEISDSRADPEITFLQGERSQMLSAAINRLTPGLRKAIELRELGELSTEEAARVMGLTVAAVKARVFIGRRKLHKVLSKSARTGTAVLQASRKANSLSQNQFVCGCGSCD